MSIPGIALNTGAGIPQVGLGTYPLDDAQAADAVVAAIEAGYRHIDTATRYGNETGVGEGIRRAARHRLRRPATHPLAVAAARRVRVDLAHLREAPR